MVIGYKKKTIYYLSNFLGFDDNLEDLKAIICSIIPKKSNDSKK